VLIGGLGIWVGRCLRRWTRVILTFYLFLFYLHGVQATATSFHSAKLLSFAGSEQTPHACWLHCNRILYKLAFVSIWKLCPSQCGIGTGRPFSSPHVLVLAMQSHPPPPTQPPSVVKSLQSSRRLVYAIHHVRCDDKQQVQTNRVSWGRLSYLSHLALGMARRHTWRSHWKI